MCRVVCLCVFVRARVCACACACSGVCVRGGQGAQARPRIRTSRVAFQCINCTGKRLYDDEDEDVSIFRDGAAGCRCRFRCRHRYNIIRRSARLQSGFRGVHTGRFWGFNPSMGFCFNWVLTEIPILTCTTVGTWVV